MQRGAEPKTLEDYRNEAVLMLLERFPAQFEAIAGKPLSAYSKEEIDEKIAEAWIQFVYVCKVSLPQNRRLPEPVEAMNVVNTALALSPPEVQTAFLELDEEGREFIGAYAKFFLSIYHEARGADGSVGDRSGHADSVGDC